MSKIDNKYLLNYSTQTLRDVDLAGLAVDDYLVFDGSNFVNKQVNKYGTDFSFKERVGLESFSGGTFQIYDSLTFNVSEDGNNSYRFNADFLWGHDSASSDIRIAIRIDGGANIKELRIEPKDSSTDQRFQNNILKYFVNLSQGLHVVDLLVRPSSNSRTSRMYESILEIQRCQ